MLDDIITSCYFCGSSKIVRVRQYDSAACIDCRNWLEEKCRTDDCCFCANRPENAKEVVMPAVNGPVFLVHSRCLGQFE